MFFQSKFNFSRFNPDSSNFNLIIGSSINKNLPLIIIRTAISRAINHVRFILPKWIRGKSCSHSDPVLLQADQVTVGNVVRICILHILFVKLEIF